MTTPIEQIVRELGYVEVEKIMEKARHEYRQKFKLCRPSMTQRDFMEKRVREHYEMFKENQKGFTPMIDTGEFEIGY